MMRARASGSPGPGPKGRAALALAALGLTLLSAPAAAAPPNVRHVRAGAPAGGDGLSWTTAYNDLRAALATAGASGGAITELWVAQGTYIPAGPGGADPALSFTIPANVALYGGFAGSETLRDQRNPDPTLTILNGDSGVVRAYNVVVAAGNPFSIFDGFTVTGGRANQAGTAGTGWAGAGIHVTGSPTIRNTRIVGNVTAPVLRTDTVFRKGAGVYCAVDSAPTFIDCYFGDNAGGNGYFVTPGAGGGLAADDCLFRLVRCTFENNRSGVGGWGECVDGQLTGGVDGGPGGAIYIGPSVGALIESCTFRNNTTGESVTPQVCVLPPTTTDCKHGGPGGAIYSEDSFVVVVNSLFIGNTTADGAHGQDGSPSHPSSGGNGGNGAALWSTGGSLAVVNSTFIDNAPGVGAPGSEPFPFTGKPAGHAGAAGLGAAAFASSTLQIENCIIWNGGIAEITGGPVVAYSNVQGGYPGVGNIDEDPRFVDAAAGDFRLAADSPCIDAGNSLIDINPFSPDVQPLPAVDGGGLPRLVNAATPDTGVGSPAVDMGMHEYQTACAVDFNGDGLVDFADYLEFLAYYDAQDVRADLNGDGIVDFADYTEFLNLFDAKC